MKRMPKILIVEDDKYLNKLISDRFSLEGFDVISVLDGESGWFALEDAHRDNQKFDYLLSDMLLPKLMGAELFKRIRESDSFSNLKIIAMSGIYKEPKLIDEMKTIHGLEGYWTKPFSLDDLIVSIGGKSMPGAAPELAGGQLRQRQIEKIFLDAYKNAFTGKLVLKNAATERRIFFSSGFPVGADSNAISESLGHALIQMGYIDEAARERASQRMVAEKKQLGQTLIELNLLTKEQLFDAIRKHSYNLLVSSFRWREGSYEYIPLTDLPSYILQLEFNPLLLVLQAQKAQFPKELIFSLSETKSELFLHRTARFFQLLPLLNLDEKSLEFISNISASDRLSAIASSFPEQAREALLRVFYLFETLGELDWKTTPQDDVPKPAAADFKHEFKQEKKTPVDNLKNIQAEYMEIVNKNYFEIFDLEQNFNERDLEDAYRALRYRLHPDRLGAQISGQGKRILDDMLGRIDKAYQTLLHANSRTEYIATINRLKSDSVAESKRFLEAQDAFRIGHRLLSNQDWEGALRHFQEARQKWSRNMEYGLYMAYADFRKILQAQGEEAAARPLKYLVEMADQGPASEAGFLLLGKAYQAINKKDLAKSCFQRALKINEHCDEASHALTKLGEDDFKKEQRGKVIQRSKAGFRKIVIWGLFLLTLAFIYSQKNLFEKRETGITEINAELYQNILPVRTIRQKDGTSKWVVKEGWMSEVPDPVLKSKCLEILERSQSYGILKLYFYDEKSGLKAVCDAEILHRY